MSSKNGAIQLLLAVNAVIMIYPLFVMVMSSFKTNAEIFSSPLRRCRRTSRLANLEKVWTQTNFRALPRQFGRHHRGLGHADPVVQHAWPPMPSPATNSG